MWLDSLKAAGYSPNTLNTRRCQMSALSRALEGDPRDVEGDDLLAHFADGSVSAVAPTATRASSCRPSSDQSRIPARAPMWSSSPP